MKRWLLMGLVYGISPAYGAESSTSSLSPVQQYLYSEAGYAPATVPTEQPVATESYESAYDAEEGFEEVSAPVENEHLRSGLQGLNF